jgi:hypothetical protein
LTLAKSTTCKPAQSDPAPRTLVRLQETEDRQFPLKRAVEARDEPIRIGPKPTLELNRLTDCRIAPPVAD